MKNLISKNRAVEIASYYYGGQWSALYQFLSSGVFMPESILKYLKEVQRCREPEYDLHPGILTQKSDKELKSLIRWFEYKAFENGIAIEWHKHNTYGYLIPYITSNIYDVNVKCLILPI